MRQVKLCASGLPTAARHAAARLGEALGARYSDCMRASTTHLLVPTRSGEKFERAAEFGVVSSSPSLSFCGFALFRVGGTGNRDGRDEEKKSLTLFHVSVKKKTQKPTTESRHARVARRLRLRGPQGRGGEVLPPAASRRCCSRCSRSSCCCCCCRKARGSGGRSGDRRPREVRRRRRPDPRPPRRRSSRLLPLPGTAAAAAEEPAGPGFGKEGLGLVRAAEEEALVGEGRADLLAGGRRRWRWSRRCF